MKPGLRWCIGLVLSLAAVAQNPSPATPAATNNSPSAAVSPAEVQQLREALAAQQKQINELRQQLEARDGLSQPHAPSLGQIASTVPILPPVLASPAPAVPSALPGTQPAQLGAASSQAIPESPLQLKIGDAYLTPIGFMDFTSVWRDHTGGSGIGTNFAGIPYGNVFQNNLSEFRLSMQNSRIGFRVDALVKGAHVIGYMESDFLGNNPGNVAVSSNSNTLRSRLYWVDVKKNKWEVLGGQTWSLITPSRSGISPMPGDLFISNDIDVNYQAGLVWGRIPELRFVYHATPKAAFAVAIDSPEQYVGGSAGGGLITFPAALTSYGGSQLDTGGTTLGTPNSAPDVIAKIALDPVRRFHVEFGGIERQFKLWNPNSKTDYSTTGGGGFLNLSVQVVKGFRLLTNNFWSNGGGRYIFGQAPDLISRVDGSPSLVHSGSTVTGFEFTHKNFQIYSYYGGIYVGRNYVIDSNGKPVGYGYAGSSAGQNRAVQEATAGFAQTFWKDPKYGALTLMGQYSYLTRNPWSVPLAGPTDANMNMVFMNLRYTLPGLAPNVEH